MIDSRNEGADAGLDHVAWEEDGFVGALDGEAMTCRIVGPGEIHALEGGAAGFAGKIEALGFGCGEEGLILLGGDFG